MDVGITRAINGLSGHSVLLDQLFKIISAYAIPVLVALVAVQWWRNGNRPMIRHGLVSAGLSFMLGLATNQAILLAFDRIRPYDAGVSKLIVAPSADPSFPSDHATAAMAIAVSLLMSTTMRRQGWAFLVAAAIVGFSRVYIGTHYASDVAGGALTGAAAAGFVALAFPPHSRLSRLLTNIL